MVNLRSLVAAGCVMLLTACGAGKEADVYVDINDVVDVQSDFGPEYQVKKINRTAIDQRLLVGTAMPAGLTFDPAECSKFAVSQQLPQGLQGNMAAVIAEGEGNRFITIALETSQSIPFTEPGRNCHKVTFTGGGIRGLIEVVDAPHIEGAQTLGVHRVIETNAGGEARVGDLYNYIAQLGNYRVMVTANSLIQPDTPVTPVDTGRAHKLLVDAVEAVSY